MNKNGILTEKLSLPKWEKAKVFTRNERKSDDKREIYSFGTSVIKRPYDVAESTSDKTLLYRASQMDRNSKNNFQLFSSSIYFKLSLVFCKAYKRFVELI